MHRLVIFTFLIFCGYITTAQNGLPTIIATSANVDIRVGDDYFAKNGWTLDPQKKPDVFSIGSKWAYDFKKVSFITDLDSISFNVQPGRRYDFVILYGQQPCHIQIATLANPAFMDLKIVLPVLAGFGVLFLLAFKWRTKTAALPLLYVGYTLPLLFWALTFISGHLHEGYHHLRNVISELGAVGTRGEVFTSASFIFLAFLSAMFSIGFYKASRAMHLSVVPAVLSFGKPVSLTWAAIFPLGNEFHGFTGPLPFLTIVASLSAFFLWSTSREFSALRKMSLFCSFLMLLIMLRFVRPFGLDYEGLVQRFFYVGWTVWVLSLSYLLSRKWREHKAKLIGERKEAPETEAKYRE